MPLLKGQTCTFIVTSHCGVAVERRKEMVKEKEEDMHFSSDCDVAAAVCLKCISTNSCTIRRERAGEERE